MTRDEFIITTKDLEEYYNKDLNFKQRETWFNELKNFDTERYSRAVKRLCMNSRYMPLLSEVIEAIRSIPVEKTEHVEPCKLCKGTGYIFYKKIVNGMECDYACLCICKNAEGKEYHSKDGYYLKTAYEVFGNNLPKEPEAEKVEKGDTKKIINDLAKQLSF